MIDTQSIEKSGKLQEATITEAPPTYGTPQTPPVIKRPPRQADVLESVGDVEWMEPVFGTRGLIKAWISIIDWYELYDEMDEEEQDLALTAMTMARLQRELDDEPDFDPHV